MVRFQKRKTKFKRKKKNGSSNASLQRQINSIRQTREYKFIDQQLQVTSGASLTITKLTNLAQGDTETTRTGSKIVITGILFKALLTDTASSNTRLMIVLDKQTNQAIYTEGDLIHDVTANDIIVSPINHNNRHRFKLLLDRVYPIDINKDTVIRRFYKVNIPILYDANVGSIADLTSNSLSFAQANDGGTGGLVLFMRLYFTDS